MNIITDFFTNYSPTQFEQLDEDSLKNLSQLIEKNVVTETDNAELLVWYGNYYWETKNYNEMEKYFITAIEKKHPKGMFYYALYFKELKKYDEMIKYYLLAIELKDIPSMFMLAEYYKYIKNYDEMIKSCQFIRTQRHKIAHPKSDEFISYNEVTQVFFHANNIINLIKNRPRINLKTFRHLHDKLFRILGIPVGRYDISN